MGEYEYVEELWYEAWPEVPWDEASDEDKRLFRDHALSLLRYRLDK